MNHLQNKILPRRGPKNGSTKLKSFENTKYEIIICISYLCINFVYVKSEI